MISLTDTLDGIDRQTARMLLAAALEGPYQEVNASLEIAYTRKECEERGPVWETRRSPYRDDLADDYVLTIEVKVPMASVAGGFEELVSLSKKELREEQEKRLEARKSVLEKELAEVEALSRGMNP